MYILQINTFTENIHGLYSIYELVTEYFKIQTITLANNYVPRIQHNIDGNIS